MEPLQEYYNAQWADDGLWERTRPNAAHLSRDIVSLCEVICVVFVVDDDP